MLNPGAPSAGALYASLIVHNYNQVFEVCDRINFLHSGEILLDASTSRDNRGCTNPLRAGRRG
jgi:hypothetical protein